jgi:hypothetical protein
MNPHPTRSKPCKIGRKHTGARRAKDKQRRLNGLKAFEKLKIARRRARNKKIAAYFRGDIATHPE